MIDAITIKGREYRIEANWRAITGYLRAIGNDSMEAVADVVSLSPSSIGGLMAACINEGERIEGRDTVVSASILDDLYPAEAIQVINDFVRIYLAQAAPSIPEEPKKEEAQ